MTEKALKYGDLSDDERSALARLVNASTASERYEKKKRSADNIPAALVTGGVSKITRSIKATLILIFENDKDREMVIRHYLIELAKSYECSLIDTSTFPSAARWGSVARSHTGKMISVHDL